MFAMRILEQLTMSTVHFHQFLNVVNDWGAFTGVVPYVYGTSLFGLRSLHASNPGGSMPFSELFNTTQHNAYLSKCMKRPPDTETGYPVLFEPMSEFLRRSYRNIVLVYFAAHTPDVLNLDIRSRVENEINHIHGALSDCTSASRKFGMSKYVEDHLATELDLERTHPSSGGPSLEHLDNFDVTRAFCVKRDIKIDLRSLRDFIFNHMPGYNNYSILFISWQGRFTHPLSNSDMMNQCRIPFSQPFHSNFIKNTANKFVRSLDFHGQPYISVHIRFEKLYFFALEHKKNVEAHLGCCMSRLNKLIAAIAHKFDILSDNILLIWDYSPHGSQTCPYGDIKRCSNLAGKYLRKIKAKSSFFDPAKFNAPSHHSVVSLVEAEAVYRGTALVTVGGGSYQTMIATTFVEHHQDGNDPDEATSLHFGHLCSSTEDLHGLNIDCN